MGTARDVMDRADAAMAARNPAALAECYAEDAVVMTPDQGELVGRVAIRTWLGEFARAFPDFSFEYAHKFEAGNVVIDEGTLRGTNTGPLVLPTGGTQEPTGQSIKLRSCDVAETENGLITRHRFYYDQVEFMEQLGMVPAQQEAQKSMRDDSV